MRELLTHLRDFDRSRPMVTDTVMAVLFALVATLGALASEPILKSVGEDFASTPTSLALTVGLMAPIAFRRRFPLMALIAHTPFFIAYRTLDVPEVSVSSAALFLMIYSAGVHGSSRHRTVVRAITVGLMMSFVIWGSFFQDVTDVPGNIRLIQAFNLALNLSFFGAAWVLGDLVRRIKDVRGALEERTVQLEKEREANEHRAITDERVRIARELHDVVAHHVSVMGVQAGAARTVIDKSPEQAVAALEAIEETSRTAVTEMHRMLGMLRSDDETDDIAPQPSMQHLESLIDSMRMAGIGVELQLVGEPRTLTPMVDLSAYRIIQEALTNTVKHAGPAKAIVRVDYTSSSLDLEIVDDGRGIGPGEGTGGNGLIGMRERALLCEGSLDAGPNPGGGFRVRASLPTGRR